MSVPVMELVERPMLAERIARRVVSERPARADALYAAASSMDDLSLFNPRDQAELSPLLVPPTSGKDAT